MPALNWGDGEEGIDAGAEMSMDGLDANELKIRNPCPSVDQLMLGGASIGCLFKEVKPDQARECVERAVEKGIRFVDTAPWYGAGLSETRLGEALSARPDVKISTKCGRIILPKGSLQIVQDNHIEKDYEGHFYTDNYHSNRVCWTYTGEGIRESQSQSATRLQREVIDCLRLHDAENKERFTEATAPGGAVDTMIALKTEGKVKEISLGMNSAQYIVAYLKKYPGKFDNIMLSNCFNLIDHNCIPLLLECQSQGVKITNVGIFASGLLWGGKHYMYDSSVPEDVKEKVTKWTALAAKYSLTLPQVAMCFAFLSTYWLAVPTVAAMAASLIRPEVVNYVAFGTSRAQAVDENVALCGTTVPVALWKEAQASGIMDPRLPLPAESDEPAAKKAKN